MRWCPTGERAIHRTSEAGTGAACDLDRTASCQRSRWCADVSGSCTWRSASAPSSPTTRHRLPSSRSCSTSLGRRRCSRCSADLPSIGRHDPGAGWSSRLASPCG
jgi:hypothetical protein